MKVLILIIFVSGILFSQVSLHKSSDTLELTVSETISADSLYNYAISKLSFLDFNDCNNCALRAHVMCFILSKQFPGIKIAKVWLFADSKLSSRKSFYMTHAKAYLSGINECPHWGFHVAPVLLIGRDTIVIDPSTQNNAVKLDQWIKTISKNVTSYVVFKKSIYYSYPEDEYKLFDDKKEDWDLKYDIRSFDNEISFIAQKLTTAYYNNIFDPIRYFNYKSILSKIISNKQN